MNRRGHGIRLSFLERFGITADTARHCWPDFERHLAPRQKQVLAAWLAVPDAGPSQIADALGITANCASQIARAARRRIRSLDGGRHKLQPQTHRPLAEKAGLDEAQLNDPDTVDFVRSILPETCRALYHELHQNPGGLTGDFIRAGGPSRKTILARAKLIAEAARVERLLRTQRSDITAERRAEHIAQQALREAS